MFICIFNKIYTITKTKSNLVIYGFYIIILYSVFASLTSAITKGSSSILVTVLPRACIIAASREKPHVQSNTFKLVPFKILLRGCFLSTLQVHYYSHQMTMLISCYFHCQ